MTTPTLLAALWELVEAHSTGEEMDGARCYAAWIAARAALTAAEKADPADPEWSRERIEAAAYSLGMRYAAEQAEPPMPLEYTAWYRNAEKGKP